MFAALVGWALLAGCFVDSNAPTHDEDTTTTGGPVSVSAEESTSPSEVTAASSSTSDGESETSETTDEARDAWHRYTFDVNASTWTTVPLDQIWIEEHAPPPRDIAAAVSLTHFDRLSILSSDGTLYERVDGGWLPPVAAVERFPMLANRSVTGMVHTPLDGVEEIYFVDNPYAVVYWQHADGSVEYRDTLTMSDAPDGAPQGTGRARWYFATVDLALNQNDPDWIHWTIAFDDDRLYRFAPMSWQWTSWPLADNHIFGVASEQPMPLTIEAAYHDDATGRIHFIGP